jgi:hypothetical protein
MSWENENYSQRAKVLKCDMPILFFSMELDSNKCVIPGCNDGRLYLYDYNHGYIHRWVATSSFNGRQSVNDWNKTGGVHPPNSHMLGGNWFWVPTKEILQPGQPVERGFILNYKGSNNWTTVDNVNRSQVMLHPDSNHETNEGSYGCLVLKPAEYKDFITVYGTCCGHLDRVRYAVGYTFQV